MTHRGWRQIGFAREFRETLNAAPVDSGTIMIIRERGGDGGDRLRAFEPRCPHRGASLCHGGVLKGEAVECPFHGLLIGLGAPVQGAFGYVREYPCFEIGGLVFVQTCSNAIDAGFCAAMEMLEQTHTIWAGFSAPMKVRPELVIENAFDALHFQPVHHVSQPPRLKPLADGSESYAATGVFVLPPSTWQTVPAADGLVRADYVARAYSPTIVVSNMGGYRPYVVITCATKRAETTMIYLSLAFPKALKASDAEVTYLLKQMQTGINQDKPIWERIDESVFSPVPGDEAVLGFRDFSARFLDG